MNALLQQLINSDGQKRKHEELTEEYKNFEEGFFGPSQLRVMKRKINKQTFYIGVDTEKRYYLTDIFENRKDIVKIGYGKGETLTALQRFIETQGHITRDYESRTYEWKLSEITSADAIVYRGMGARNLFFHKESTSIMSGQNYVGLHMSEDENYAGGGYATTNIYGMFVEYYVKELDKIGHFVPDKEDNPFSELLNEKTFSGGEFWWIVDEEYNNEMDREVLTDIAYVLLSPHSAIIWIVNDDASLEDYALSIRRIQYGCFADYEENWSHDSGGCDYEDKWYYFRDQKENEDEREYERLKEEYEEQDAYKRYLNYYGLPATHDFTLLNKIYESTHDDAKKLNQIATTKYLYLSAWSSEFDLLDFPSQYNRR